MTSYDSKGLPTSKHTSPSHLGTQVGSHSPRILNPPAAPAIQRPDNNNKLIYCTSACSSETCHSRLEVKLTSHKVKVKSNPQHNNTTTTTSSPAPIPPPISPKDTPNPRTTHIGR